MSSFRQQNTQLKIMDKPSIEHIENFFPDDIASKVAEFAKYGAYYYYGETDNTEAPPAGMVSTLFDLKNKDLFTCAPNPVKLIYKFFIKHIHEKYTGFWNDYQIYRLYINVFSPREFSYFHTDSGNDSDQWTFIYYPTLDFDYDINQGGCTEFYLDNKIIGVPPIPNSICRFSSYVKHRATSFKDYHRFSFAIKCVNKSELEERIKQNKKKEEIKKQNKTTEEKNKTKQKIK